MPTEGLSKIDDLQKGRIKKLIENSKKFDQTSE